MTPFSPQRGFTLIETIVATAIIATALAALAHLFALGAAQSLHNRSTLPMLAAAEGKLRLLQAAMWTYGSEAPELAVSPARSVVEDTAGYVDYLDDDTRPISSSPQLRASYVRRWAVRPLAAGDADTLVLHVCVSPLAVTNRRTCVASVRTRRP